MKIGFKLEGRLSIGQSIMTEITEGSESPGALEQALKDELTSCLDSSAFPVEDLNITIGSVEEVGT